jgi:hypothetical protein
MQTLRICIFTSISLILLISSGFTLLYPNLMNPTNSAWADDGGGSSDGGDGGDGSLGGDGGGSSDGGVSGGSSDGDDGGDGSVVSPPSSSQADSSDTPPPPSSSQADSSDTPPPSSSSTPGKVGTNAEGNTGTKRDSGPSNNDDLGGLQRADNHVDLTDMNPNIVEIYDKVNQAFRDNIDRDGIITAGRDGKHNPNTLHGRGEAIDLRTRDIIPSKVNDIVNDIRDSIGTENYDTINEHVRPPNAKVWGGPHIHIEYQPVSAGGSPRI